jgi:hypothetical protein
MMDTLGLIILSLDIILFVVSIFVLLMESKIRKTDKTGIIITGRYLVLISVLTLLVAGWSFWCLKMNIEHCRGAGAEGCEIIILASIPISLLALIQAIGILLLKNWARWLLLIISTVWPLYCTRAAIDGLVTIFRGHFENVLQFGLLSLIFAVIPNIILLVYFNRKSVKELFR